MVKDEKVSAEQVVRDIRRETRRKYSAEEKIRIVLERLRGEDSIAELCRREGINPNMYYKWSKEFLDAGKARLTGDTKREASSSEVDGLRQENDQLKQVVAELQLKNRVLKKVRWAGRRAHGKINAHLGEREVRDHPARGRLGSARQANAGGNRYTPQHLLPLV